MGAAKMQAGLPASGGTFQCCKGQAVLLKPNPRSAGSHSTGASLSLLLLHILSRLDPPLPLAAVVLACRSIPKGEALKKELEEQAAAGGQATPRLEVGRLLAGFAASVMLRVEGHYTAC